jgi:hypothetical protein
MNPDHRSVSPQIAELNRKGRSKAALIREAHRGEAPLSVPKPLDQADNALDILRGAAAILVAQDSLELAGIDAAAIRQRVPSGVP